MLPLLSLATTVAGGLFRIGREMLKDSGDDSGKSDSSSSSDGHWETTPP